jgi:FG-GAP repeat
MFGDRIGAGALVLLGVVCIAPAQVIHEDSMYFPEPTLQGQYGKSVDVDGGVMIVGAPFDNELGVSAGAAYLVDLSSGDQIRLVPAGVGAGDQFGFSVAISGDYAIVGSPYDASFGFDSGAAYIFDSTTGALLHTLSGAMNSQFGDDVDIDGSLVIVGARERNNGGEAYLFEVISGNLLHVLPKQSGFGFDEFGDGVAVNESMGVACVGAPGQYIPSIDERVGAVHVFDTGTGGFLRTLIPMGLTEPIDLGESVDASDGLVLIGAPKAPDWPVGAGAAYVFDATSGAELLTLTIDDSPAPTQRNALGQSVKLGDGVALLGAPEWDSPSTNDNFDNGAGFLFDITSGQLLEVFYPANATLGDRTGSGVGVDGSTVVLGSPTDDYPGGFDAGSVGVYSLPCAADLTMDGALNFLDVSAFLSAFSFQDPAADFNHDGMFNFLDVSAFLAAFSAGCP